MKMHQQYDFNVVFLCKLFMRFMCNDVTLSTVEQIEQIDTCSLKLYSTPLPQEW